MRCSDSGSRAPSSRSRNLPAVVGATECVGQVPGRRLVAPHQGGFHHETAVHSLKFLQEIEPETWNRITARVSGVNAVSQARETYEVPKALPFMFPNWREYRDYLLEHLITDPAIREIFRHKFALIDAQFLPEAQEALTKCEIAALLVNDYEGTKLGNFASGHDRLRKGFGKGRDRFSYHEPV